MKTREIENQRDRKLDRQKTREIKNQKDENYRDKKLER